MGSDNRLREQICLLAKSKFARGLTGLTNGTGKGNGLMPKKGFFDYSWVNIMSTPNDKIFCTTSNPKVFITIFSTEITRS